MSEPTGDRRGAVRVVRSSSSPPWAFRVQVILYSLAFVVVCVIAVAGGSYGDFGLVLTLGVLFLAAEHRDRVFVDETGLSGSIAVALCASVVFADQSWVGGAFLCCALGGLYLPHLRSHAISKVVVNATSFGVSALASASVFSTITSSSDSVLRAALGLLAATGTYWMMNSALLALATAAISRDHVRNRFLELIRSDTVMLAFGFGGALCGVVMTEVGTWTGVATLVALLVALDVFVISVPAGLSQLRSAWAVVLARGVACAIAGAVGAVVTRTVAISALGAAAGLAAGMVAGVSMVMLIVGARLFAMHRDVDPSLVVGLACVELAFPIIGAVTGVVTAMAGVDAGLICASLLVVAGSAAVAIRRRRSHDTRPQIDDDALMVAVVEALLDGLPSSTREHGGSRSTRG